MLRTLTRPERRRTPQWNSGQRRLPVSELTKETLGTFRFRCGARSLASARSVAGTKELRGAMGQADQFIVTASEWPPALGVRQKRVRLRRHRVLLGARGKTVDPIVGPILAWSLSRRCACLHVKAPIAVREHVAFGRGQEGGQRDRGSTPALSQRVPFGSVVRPRPDHGHADPAFPEATFDARERPVPTRISLSRHRCPRRKTISVSSSCPLSFSHVLHLPHATVQTRASWRRRCDASCFRCAQTSRDPRRSRAKGRGAHCRRERGTTACSRELSARPRDFHQVSASSVKKSVR